MRSCNRRPGSVGETLRVVRFSRRTPKRDSNWRTIWLRADRDSPK
ncbi:hypothetical protein [Lysobacter gummosus]